MSLVRGRATRNDTGRVPDDPAYEGALLSALARSFGVAGPSAYSIRPLRSAGRSQSHVVEGPAPRGGHGQWFVKQSRPESTQEDLSSPVSAQAEFEALQRLWEDLSQRGERLRVPRPEAVLPELSSLVMEFVPGRRLVDLFRYRSLRRPGPVLDGLVGSARLLRHVHALESHPPCSLDLRVEADHILGYAEARLEPAGLALPTSVARLLHELPHTLVESSQVLLHGDFVPHNFLLGDDGSIVGVDPGLTTVGCPEDDLARYVVVMSGAIRFSPELALPPLTAVRRALVDRLVAEYYEGLGPPVLLELRVLALWSRRWLRLRQLAAHNRGGPASALRVRLVDAHVGHLMHEAADRLSRNLA